MAGFGPNFDGSILPGDRSYLTSDGNRYQRGMAFNPATSHVLVVDRRPGQESVHVLGGEWGEDISTLDMSALTTGGNSNFRVNLIGVADDGAIYVANLSNSQLPPQFRLYRWENEGAPQTLVFAGDPSNGNTNSANQRWGDTLAVRGSGVNTEVLIASRGTLVAILRPTDATMTAFTSTPLATDTPPGSLGFGLCFGPGNTFYGTSGAQNGGPLYKMAYDLGAGTATRVAAYNSMSLSGTVTPIHFDAASGLLVGLDITDGPDLVSLYNAADPANPPVFLDREPLLIDNPNTVFAGALAITTNGVVYALDSDNGMMAFTVVTSSVPVAPRIFSQPRGLTVLVGSNVTFSAAADGTLPLSYQWQSNGVTIVDATNQTYNIPNAQTNDAAVYSVVVSNTGGSTTSSNAPLAVLAAPQADLVLYEPFDYADGSALSGQGGWALNGSGTSATVEAGNLDVTNLEPSAGNRIFWRGSSMSLRRPLGTNINSGTVFYSFAMRVDNLGAAFTGAGVLAGFTTGTGTAFAPKVDIRPNGSGGFQLGVSKPGAATQKFHTNDYAVGETIFIVGRYVFGPSAGDDTASLWINPDSNTFGAENPPPPTLDTTGGTDLAQIDRFFWRAGAASTTPDKLVTDELRVAFAWKSVTPPNLPPKLKIVRNGGTVVISWPTRAENFYLEFAAALPATSWAPVVEPVIVQGDENTVTIDSPSGNAFFRLAELE